jgi:4-amino-4-deoxy-L-arabinose transferase-like glycosyltransferase
VPLGAVAAAFAALQLLTVRVGFHRDELYFLACARRLAWGYVDQPPLTPFLARLSLEVLGPWPPGLRLVPALAGAATAVVTGLIARELGAGPRLQVLAAAITAGSALSLGVHHLISTTSNDYLLWAVALLIVARLLRTTQPRLWVSFGAVCGLGLLNKHTMLFLGLGVVAGVAVTPARRLLASPWLIAGGVVALAIWAPNLIWQAQHGWPTIGMLGALADRNDGLTLTLRFIPDTLLMQGVAAALWPGGLWWLLRDRRFAALGWGWLVVFAVLFVLGGRSYYLGGMFPPLFAAAAAGAGQLLGPRRLWSAREGFRLVALGLLLAPLAVPILPVTVPVDVTGQIREQYGWPEVAATVAGVRDRLPPGARDDVVVLARDYGLAAAVEWYGPALDLPVPVSGHNGYGLWGPGDAAGTTIAVGYRPDELAGLCDEAVQAAVVRFPEPVANLAQGAPISVCEPSAPWAELWPRVRYVR